MFLNAAGKEIACPDANAGLYIQTRTGDKVRVSIPADHCAFQIGETSQIMSGGLLQATPHAVLTTTMMTGPSVSDGGDGGDGGVGSSSSIVTRESFAVFLEPEFDHRLDLPNGFSVDDCCCSEGHDGPYDALGLQPLKARWKPGQTFGDFHLATVSAFTTSDQD